MLASVGEVALIYPIQERFKVVHHDRLKPYTLPMPAMTDPMSHALSPIQRALGRSPQPNEGEHLVRAHGDTAWGTVKKLAPSVPEVDDKCIPLRISTTLFYFDV